ncbi:MAG: hypothetical protein EOO17_01465 [Chloroflexi bacterium]|nr:MAG: hypothetical protein EOO17_01465 [Chloroflexota bacterium]
MPLVKSIDIWELDAGQALDVRTNSDSYWLVMTSHRQLLKDSEVKNIALMPRSLSSIKYRDAPANTVLPRVIQLGDTLRISNSRWRQIDAGIVQSIWLHQP